MVTQILKLVTGDEIISDTVECLDDEGDKCLELHNPMVLMVMPDGLAMMPYISPFTDVEMVKIRTSHSLYPVKPNDKLTQAYHEHVEKLKQQRSGIVTPPKGLILPG